MLKTKGVVNRIEKSKIAHVCKRTNHNDKLNKTVWDVNARVFFSFVRAVKVLCLHKRWLVGICAFYVMLPPTFGLLLMILSLNSRCYVFICCNLCFMFDKTGSYVLI